MAASFPGCGGVGDDDKIAPCFRDASEREGAALARDVAFAALPDHPGSLHVKHTFLEFIDAGEQPYQESEAACMRRACSDSALCLQAGVCDSDDDLGCGSEEEVVMLGFSDDDTDAEKEQASSTATGTRSRPSSVGSAPLASDSTPPEPEASEQGSSPQSMTADMLRRKLEEMASENARLSQENVALRQRAAPVAASPDVLEAPAVAQSPGVCPGVATAPTGMIAFDGYAPDGYAHNGYTPDGFAHDGFAQMPQCLGAWWLPAGVNITPVACFPMPTEPVKQPAPQPEELPRRSRKVRASRASREKCPAQRTGVILPNPTKTQAGPPLKGPQTTVMVRNMPNNYSREMFIALLEAEGFAGQFGFLYLPMDFESQACLGYAFVDCVSTAVAARLWNTFDGYTNWAIPSRKASGVSWSAPLQGLRAHVERYRNSPVMAEDVPDEFKPVIFEKGVRLPFPPSTRPLRATWQGRHATSESSTQHRNQDVAHADL